MLESNFAFSLFDELNFQRFRRPDDWYPSFCFQLPFISCVLQQYTQTMHRSSLKTMGWEGEAQQRVPHHRLQFRWRAARSFLPSLSIMVLAAHPNPVNIIIIATIITIFIIITWSHSSAKLSKLMIPPEINLN